MIYTPQELHAMADELIEGMALAMNQSLADPRAAHVTVSPQRHHGPEAHRYLSFCDRNGYRWVLRLTKEPQ